MERAPDASARIERGIVKEVTPVGCKVQSCTRYGVTTPPLPCAAQIQCAVGDGVYYFLFEDGHGMIIGRM